MYFLQVEIGYKLDSCSNNVVTFTFAQISVLAKTEEINLRFSGALNMTSPHDNHDTL